MNALLTIAALAVFVGLLIVAVAVGVAIGATTYAIHRKDNRESLRQTDRIAYVFLGPYRSPFPWHRNTVPYVERAA